jgi:hypothetical protein
MRKSRLPVSNRFFTRTMVISLLDCKFFRIYVISACVPENLALKMSYTVNGKSSWKGRHTDLIDADFMHFVKEIDKFFQGQDNKIARKGGH